MSDHARVIPKTALFSLFFLAFSALAACSSSPCNSTDCTLGAGGSTSSASGTGGAGGGTFPCKDVTCTRGTEVCEVISHNLENDMGQCIPLPAACSDPAADCTCFGDLMGCTCQKQPDSTFAVFCDLPQ